VGCPTACARKVASGIVLVHKNEPAPFTGDLYPIDESVRFALEIERCGERARVDLDHAKRLHQVELARIQSMAQASAAADRKRVEVLTAQLQAAGAWYRSTPFVAAVAVVSTVAVLLVSTVLVQATAEVRH
jgi:hypothetical protein